MRVRVRVRVGIWGTGRLRLRLRLSAGHLQVARRSALDGAQDARVERLCFRPVEVKPLLL